MNADEETPDAPPEGREPKRRGLGRGLSALLGDETEESAELDRLRLARMVPIEFIFPGHMQPRGDMNEEGLAELAESIRVKGLLQPLLVRRQAEDPNRFEIIAGERRWRAAQRAELHEVPVIVKELTDQEALEIALIENLQREDLSSLEEAGAYRRLLDEFGHTQEDLARGMGKSRSHVANSMRLLTLPDPVKDMLNAGRLTAGHARAVLNAEDPVGLAQIVVRRGLNVRQTERLVAAGRDGGRTRQRPAEKDSNALELEEDLSRRLGLKVRINPGRQGGNVTIHYQSLEQLDEVILRLTRTDRDGVATAMPDAVQEDLVAAIDPSEDFAALAEAPEPGDEVASPLAAGAANDGLAPIEFDVESGDNIETTVFDTDGTKTPAGDVPGETFLDRVEELLAVDAEFWAEVELDPEASRDDADTLIADIQPLLDAEDGEAARPSAAAAASLAEDRGADLRSGDIDPEAAKVIDDVEALIVSDDEDADAEEPKPPENQD